MHWLAVALGGSIGAMSRYGLSIVIPNAPGKFPVATFATNVLGSLLMAALFVLIVEKGALPAMWRQALMVGFLGAFTTFSTFSLESLHLISEGHGKLAFTYMLSSVLACLFAAFSGYHLIHKLIIEN
ncbi:MAG: fluoride efflux transporter CrcB [Agarilytica sp.]